MNDYTRSSSNPRLTVRVWRHLSLLLLLGLAVHLLLPQIATFERSLQVLKSMTWWVMALAIGAQVLSYLGSGYLLQSVATTLGQRLSVIRGTLITLAAYSIGLVAGGSVGSGAATYRWMRSSGVSPEGALSAAWLPNLFNTGGLIIASFFGTIHLLISHDLSTVQLLAFGLIVLILGSIAGGVVWGMRRQSQLTHLAVRIAARWAGLRQRRHDPAPTIEAVGRVFRAWDAIHAGGWRGPALGAAINLVFDMLTLYFIFMATGHPVSPGVLLAGYGLPLLLAKVTILPGGVGIVEGGMAALYASLGVLNAVTVVVVLTYRFISFWLPSLVGFSLVPYLQYISRGAPGKQANADSGASGPNK